MKELKEPCKTAIHNGYCLGCNKLENPDFEKDEECEYGSRLCNKIS